MSGRARHEEKDTTQTDVDRRFEHLSHAVRVILQDSVEGVPQVVQRARQIGIVVLRGSREGSQQRSGRMIVRNLPATIDNHVRRDL